MPRFPVATSKEAAEKLFNKKASPDADLPPKEFINKKVMNPIKNYGKNVLGGVKIVGGGIRRFGRKIKTGLDNKVKELADDLLGSPEIEAKQKAAGAALNASYSGKRRSTSSGSMR